MKRSRTQPMLTMKKKIFRSSTSFGTWELGQPGATLQSLKILTLNVDGLREAGQPLALPACAGNVGADILVTTEPHLRLDEARKLEAAGFSVASGGSREPDLVKMRGGAGISAKTGLSFTDWPCRLVHLRDGRLPSSCWVFLPP